MIKSPPGWFPLNMFSFTLKYIALNTILTRRSLVTFDYSFILSQCSIINGPWDVSRIKNNFSYRLSSFIICFCILCAKYRWLTSDLFFFLLLPQPCAFACLSTGWFICGFVCQQDYANATEWIPQFFWGKMGHEPKKNLLNFGTDPDKGTDPGFVFYYFLYHGETRPWRMYALSKHPSVFKR